MRTRFPNGSTCAFDLRQPLRYGENPHQKAAFYVEPAAAGTNLATAKLRHGKELSYNNLLDLDSALRLVRQFAEPAACILKHNNPCGAADRRGHGRRVRTRVRGRSGQCLRGHRGFEPARRSRHGRANVPAGPIPGSDSGPWIRRRRTRMASDQTKLAQQRPSGRPRGADRPRAGRRLRVSTSVASREAYSFRAGTGSSPSRPRDRSPRAARPPRPSCVTSRSPGVSVPRSNPMRSCWRRMVRSSVSARAR